MDCFVSFIIINY